MRSGHLLALGPGPVDRSPDGPPGGAPAEDEEVGVCRGDALARTDLTSGAVQVMCKSIATSVEPVRVGQWRGLATTGLRRASNLPDLPTLDEAGLRGYEVTSWMGLFGPKGMPADVRATLQRAFDAAFADPGMQVAATRLGQDIITSTPAEHLAFMQRQEAAWKPILEGIGFGA